RYGRLWNMVAAPLRLPLRAEWLSRLDQNEVMTYVGSGFIEVGPSLGMTVESAHAKLSDLGISASIRAYLRGEFRIAVMKLGEKRARVKISRRAERGVTGGINSSSRFELYEGFVVLGSRNGRLRTSLVPFTFTADRALGHSFEVGYEFDLNDERAVEAYERAVLGQFGPCDELALETAADGESAPVKRTFSRESEDTRSSRSIGMKIYFLKHTGDSVYTVQDAKIQFPDGTFRVFKARTDASYQRSLGVGIWKSSETIQYSIRTDFLKKLHSQDPAAIGLIAEGRIEDNSTSGVELNRYSEMVESLFGNSKIFPQVPIYLPNNEPEVLAAEADPLTESAKYYQPTRYGYSSFYFRVGLTEAQLLRLANVSPEKMWEHLENGFERSPGSWTRTSGRVVSGAGGWLANAFGWLGDVGDIDQHLGARFFRARSFRDQWLELSGLAEKATTADGQKAFAKKIGEMYSDKIFAYELIKTTMFALRDLGDQDTSFQINAQSAAFGGRELRGGAITEIERITQRYAQETDFDQPSIRQDLTLEVASLKVEQKEDQGNFELKFHASRKPGVVVVKLDELSDYLRVATTLRRLMIPNRGQFNAGVNLFPLDREGKPGFQRELACSLRPGRNYRVTVALIDGENVGPGQSEEFFVNPVKSEGFVGPCPEAELAQ
ncbi:MAG: hypothetical protein NDJ90_12935, partial [Oligoflexia bacterium]|nr:hypothetical protein [Oligoflexia bacterium]